MHHKTYTGIVLKRNPYREADALVTLWSWEKGKLPLLARGVLKQTSKLKAVLSPIVWVQVQTAGARQLQIVTAARIAASYPRILGNLNHLAIVFNVFEHVLRSCPDGQNNHGISILLRQSLEYLERTPHAGIDFLIGFRMRFLQALGYELDFARCRQCQNELQSGVQLFWSGIYFGLICSACSRFDRFAQSADADVVEYFVQFPQVALEAFQPQHPISADLKFKIERMLGQILHTITERRFNSTAFLVQNLRS